MFKGAVATAEFVARLTLVLLFVACGGKGADRSVGPGNDKPVVIPPTLVPGTSQVFAAALNTGVEVAPFVTLKNQNGAGIADRWIVWTPSSGKVENDSSLTDVNGRATAGAWTLSTVSGIQTVTARVGDISVIAITADVAPGPMVALVAGTAPITAVVGSNVLTPPSVKAVDKYGNGVPNIFVQFAIFEGGGSITGNAQTTDDNGLATVGSWKLGPTAGAQSLRADEHITGATTMVRATALPALATQFAIVDGNAQTGQANKRLCTSPSIAVLDQFGNGVAQVPIVFTPSAGSGVVTDGLVQSSAGTGYATVGAWTLSDAASQTLVVTSPSLPGLSVTLTATVAPSAVYSVCVRFLGTGITPRERQAVSTAVQRWQRVIVGHVQSTQLSQSAGTCFVGSPTINEVVEDLLVFVQVAPIDGPGNVVARGGPCTVHMPSGLTQMGVLQIDSVDVDLLLNQGTLDNVITHELGHLLGFGTLWTPRGLLSGAGSDDPFFTGVTARAQFAKLFSAYAGTPVPVENIGDIGTRDTHWRRSVFNNELMQGFITANMPMSSVTVGSFGDLGYVVDVSKADPFPSTSALQSLSVSGASMASDVLQNEVWGVDKGGRRSLVRAARNPLNPY
jgi:hypothetical protein